MILNLGKEESVMFKILNKKVLHENILQFTLEAPLIARKAEPGQFVVLRVNEYGERVPLIIVDLKRNYRYYFYGNRCFNYCISIIKCRR